MTGTIPAWACGTLFRTGPGQSQIEGTTRGTYYVAHWFDGLAHSHRFDIVPRGTPDSDRSPPVKVLYSSRRQSEALVKHILKHGRRLTMSFAQRREPCIGLLGKFMGAWRASRAKPENRTLENICVAVQMDVPGLRPAQAPTASEKFPGDSESLGLESSKSNEQPSLPSRGQNATAGQQHSTVWITSDIPGMRQIDTTTLEPIGYARQDTLHPQLKGPLTCAHAQRCPRTGDMFNFNTELGRVPTYRVFHVSASTGQTSILATIQRPDLRPAYIHSLWLTENFVVLCVPSTHLGGSGLKMLWEGNLLDAIEPFDEGKQWRWFVVDRHGRNGVIQEFESPAGFFFHTVNAYEDWGEESANGGGGKPKNSPNAAYGKSEARRRTVDIYCDLIAYPTTDVLFSLYYNVIMDREGAAAAYWGDESRARETISRLVRYRLRVPAPESTAASNSSSATPSIPRNTVQTAECVFTILGPHAGELPTINAAYATRRHRYVYSLPSRGLSTLVDTIAKTDTLTREALLWTAPRGHTPGEAIFVGRPKGRYEDTTKTDGSSDPDEDDGVLLSVVLDGVKRTSYLLCLDAKTMRELGRADVGFPLGLGFHGAHTQIPTNTC